MQIFSFDAKGKKTRKVYRKDKGVNVKVILGVKIYGCEREGVVFGPQMSLLKGRQNRTKKSGQIIISQN